MWIDKNQLLSLNLELRIVNAGNQAIGDLGVPLGPVLLTLRMRFSQVKRIRIEVSIDAGFITSCLAISGCVIGQQPNLLRE